MTCIAILAIGSLIEDPGEELDARVRGRVEGVRTPFKIEFARKSHTRGCAPTLIPVDNGGLPVNGVLLEIDPSIGLTEAKDLLWRRETRREFSGKRYVQPTNPGPDHVLVECIVDYCGFDFVLYTKIGGNIDPLTADHLAELAIRSARGKAGVNGRDGISYLASVRRQGITTPLTHAYEAAILQETGARSLDEAHARIREDLA